jgi:hypothetical protein
MGWLRWLGFSVFLGSLAVAGGAAINQLFTGDHQLSWSAAYFALIFTVLGAMLNQLPARTGRGEGKASRRRYLRRVRASVEQMETIGLVTQAEYVLRTRQVYVDVVLQPRPVTETVTDSGVGGVTPEAMGTRMPLSSFLKRGCVLAVLGAAGSGKTTLVRYTALEMAEQRWWPWKAEFWRPRQIPVLLYLRDHIQAIMAEPPGNLGAVAAAAPWLEGAVAEAWLQRRLERGRCVVLLDGLDEVADARERAAVARWVDTQISRYPGNSVLVTSRPVGYDDNRVARADVLQVQRFSHSQIQEFLSAWFRAIEHRARRGADPGEIDRIAARGADDLVRRITAMPALLDLAANPLLLTMIANVHRYRGSLPGSRADLYSEMCQVLLHRRQEAKNLTAPHPALDDLSGDAKERLIRRLAWEMMLRRQRDIPAADAEAAIGPLPYTPGPVLTAQAFLDYARRSGLLLEHQPGHYGFAHLSLQEYLAAVHVPGDERRRRVLIDHVGDSWWRETILLWAAHNDASHIVEACLAVRTVPALSLAYACADQAAELDRRLRDQLTGLLTGTPADLAEARLLDGVAADRQLRESTRLDDGTAICAAPVSQDLWNRYLRPFHSGDSPASSPAPASTAVSEPARVVWAAGLPGFLDWLNGLSDDGPPYRLPFRAELAQLPAWAKIGHGTVWTFDEADGYHLYQPEGISHPHSPTPEQLRAYPSLIIDRLYLLLHLASNTELQLSRLLVYGYLDAGVDLPRHPEDQLIQALDLLAAIEAVEALDVDLDLDRDLYRARDLAHGLAHDLAHDSGLRRDGFSVRVSALDIDVARDLAPGLAFALDRALDRDLRADDIARAREFVPELDAARAIALDLTRTDDLTRAIALDLTRTRDLTRAIALDLDRGHAHGLALDLDTHLALYRARAHDLHRAHGLALDRARDLAFGLDRASTPDRARDLALYLTLAVAHGLDLDLARDLAVARLLHSNPRYPEITGAGIGLLEGWTARSGKATPGFFVFVADALADCGKARPQDDPLRTLERISAQIEDAWTRELLVRALKLIAPLQGDDPPLQDDLVLAAALVLAAILGGPQGEEGSGLHVALLKSVLATLIALTIPDHQNQTVLLVKG